MNRSILKVAIFYTLVIVICGIAYAAIHHYGEQLLPTQTISTSDTLQVPGAHTNHVLHILLALVVVIVVARICGLLFSFINQPMVIGEVVGGIILGPSLLGKFFPQAMEYLVPTSVAHF